MRNYVVLNLGWQLVGGPGVCIPVDLLKAPKKRSIMFEIVGYC